jgi:hypothetical protein
VPVGERGEGVDVSVPFAMMMVGEVGEVGDVEYDKVV